MLEVGSTNKALKVSVRVVVPFTISGGECPRHQAMSQGLSPSPSPSPCPFPFPHQARVLVRGLGRFSLGLGLVPRRGAALPISRGAAGSL